MYPLNCPSMKNILFSLTIVLFSNFCRSQVEAEKKIFYKIILENSTNNEFYIGCEKSKTSFDSAQFSKESGLIVPSNILDELSISSKKSEGGNWEPIFPINSDYIPALSNPKNCQDKNNIEAIFKKKKKRQSIFLLSEPIFDNNFEHCVISFSCIRFKGSAYGSSYFLKKVYGSWTIIAVFDSWVS